MGHRRKHRRSAYAPTDGGDPRAGEMEAIHRAQPLPYAMGADTRMEAARRTATSSDKRKWLSRERPCQKGKSRIHISIIEVETSIHCMKSYTLIKHPMRLDHPRCITVSPSHHRRTCAVPSPYLRRCMFGFRYEIRG